MTAHCHHYYDENNQPVVLQHDHDFESVRHIEPAIPAGLPIYWDHEGFNCDPQEDT